MLTLGKFTHRSTWEKAVLVFDGQPVILVVFLCNGPCLANYFKCDHLQNLFKTLPTEIKEWKLFSC